MQTNICGWQRSLNGSHRAPQTKPEIEAPMCGDHLCSSFRCDHSVIFKASIFLPSCKAPSIEAVTLTDT